jgi:Asp-tRNA(Asn)/Glu-tRNA(Gln) amidotransferase A subunit family amidase
VSNEPIAGSTTDPRTGWGGMTITWSYAGLPCITIPAGLSDSRLPLGLQCVGTFNNDELLLPWAAEIAKNLAANLKPNLTRK